MRPLRFTGLFFGLVAAFTAYGCMLDVSGLAPDTGSTTSTGSVGGAGPSSSSATGLGGSTGTDNPISSVSSASCESMIELCDDGVDNNCDGLIDCADPGCKGTPSYVCAPGTPQDWSIVTFTTDMNATCPAGYGALQVVASKPTDTGTTCDCACGTLTKNPCTQGMLTITPGVMACGAPSFTANITGGCDAVGKVNGNYKTVRASVLPVQTVSCNVMPTNPPPVAAVGGVICKLTATPGGGCVAGAACVPQVASADVCIQHTGDMPCPSDSLKHRYVVAQPSDLLDQRSCGACSCTSKATSCSNATLTGYDDACNTGASSVKVDGSCNDTAPGTSFDKVDHVKYDATPDTLACAPMSATTTQMGGFTLNNPITVCCP